MLTKRKLHDENDRAAYWAAQPVSKRVEALEIIRGTPTIPFMFNKHFREFLEFLEKRNVKYLLVGGYAVGYSRFPALHWRLGCFYRHRDGQRRKNGQSFHGLWFRRSWLTKGKFFGA